ncbi:MAG: hypothetical protein JST73_06905 [Actinobacteria bacterium]|nr:hypothetical protein [Actinomycetota bacterium]
MIAVTACSSSPKADPATFCSSYDDVATAAAKLANPDDVPIVTFRRQVRTIDSAAAAAAHKAPADIADAVDAVIEPLHQLSQDLDTAGSQAAVTRALARYRVGAHKVAVDQTKLDSWVHTNCGFTSVTSTTTPITIQPSATS